MGGPRKYLFSEINQTEKDNMCYHLYVESKK